MVAVEIAEIGEDTEGGRRKFQPPKAKVLGVSSSTSYELMHEPDFPVLNVGSRMVVPKEAFIQWVTKHTEGGVRE